MNDVPADSGLLRMQPGLYELLVTAGLQDRLAGMDARLLARHELHRAEVADRIALHLGVQMERALAGVQAAQRVETAVAVAKALLMRLTWRLHFPLSGDVFTQFAAAVA